MLEVQIEATMGAVTGVLGLILAFVFVRQGSNGNYTVLALGAIFFLAAGWYYFFLRTNYIYFIIYMYTQATNRYNN